METDLLHAYGRGGIKETDTSVVGAVWFYGGFLLIVLVRLVY